MALRVAVVNRTSTSNSYFTNLKAEYENARAAITELKSLPPDVLKGVNPDILLSDLETHYQSLIYRLETAVPMERSLTSPLPPRIDRTKLKGMPAYRAWNLSITGILKPSIVGDFEWKEVSFADDVPTPTNSHGLHATRIEQAFRNNYNDFACGLIDAYGKVIEHSDGVIRAECARVLAILINISINTTMYYPMVAGLYESICHHYPNVPVYIITSYQKTLFLSREMLLSAGVI